MPRCGLLAGLTGHRVGEVGRHELRHEDDRDETLCDASGDIMSVPLCRGRLEGMLPMLCDIASELLNNRSTYDMYHQVAITYL
jgi:hypothetical protein